ncbi:P-loop containing nucleoside triphosphate hydrolase protein [Panus rudis PR-1116 ss-1]|nr:P-loop containing nucleoside triphosphate hydrolase protein [Panus rudis PR-1116 ss-1]
MGKPLSSSAADVDVKTCDDTLHPSLRTEYIGVWRIIIDRGHAIHSASAYLENLTKSTKESLAILTTFIKDVYGVLGFKLFAIYTLSTFSSGMQDAGMLWLSNNLLTALEQGLMSGNLDRPKIIFWLIADVLFAALTAFASWSKESYNSRIRARIKSHYERMALQNHLHVDYATSSVNSSQREFYPLHCWTAFQHLFCIWDAILSTFSQIMLIAGLSKDLQSGLMLGVVCLAKPVYWQLSGRRLWDFPAFAFHAVNPHFLRAKSLYKLVTDPKYKQDIVSGAMEEYIRHEYASAQEKLGETSDDFATTLYHVQPTPVPGLILSFLQELPLLYFIFTCLLSSKSFSLASLGILHQMASSLRYTFERIASVKNDWNANLTHIKSVYEGIKITNVVKDGERNYPGAILGASQPNEGVNEGIRGGQEMQEILVRSRPEPNSRGMKIELRDVTFQYPSKSQKPSPKPALRNISFTIPASSLVVIVGTNGSGKSSLVKLLAQLYRPTSGEILIDDVRVEEYKVGDLRRSTAVLSQEHALLPLSVEENVAIGDPEGLLHLKRSSSYSSEATDGQGRIEKRSGTGSLRDKVIEAASLGGAKEFVEKVDGDGWAQPVSSPHTAYSSQYPIPSGPLKDVYDSVEKVRGFSGGEKQRLVASRIFMRILSNRMHFVIVDEPSSAMDPEGEFELFERLREKKGEKTMVFVTHRFGHLTKFADLILCMKDGELVEIGKHDELVKKEGEYAKLYNIQARAFSSHLAVSEP